MNRSTVIGFVLLFTFAPIAAQEFYDLKSKSVHCATPQPIVSGDIYPLAEKGCAIVSTVWGLLEKPIEVQRGVLKVSMGGRFGTRYIRASDVVKE